MRICSIIIIFESKICIKIKSTYYFYNHLTFVIFVVKGAMRSAKSNVYCCAQCYLFWHLNSYPIGSKHEHI